MSERYFSAVRQRRSQLEIKILVLKTIADGIYRHSHVLHQANLSWQTFHGIIRVLEQQRLITASGTDRRKEYALTERGQRVLKAYSELGRKFELLVSPFLLE